MKKIIKMCMVFFIGLFIFNTHVLGEELQREYTTYKYYRTNGEHGFSDILYIERINGKVSYCVEPGLKVGNSYEEGNLNDLNISDNSLKKIKLIAYYGYDFPGHNSIKYYAAAQALIWEELLGDTYKISFHDDLFGRGGEYNVDNEKSEIMNLVNKFYILPSYANQTFYIGNEQEIILEDNNKMISEYSGIGTIRGNNLIIPTNFEKLDYLKKTVYEYNQKLYISEGKQALLTTGNPQRIEFSIYLKRLKGQINITKYDENKNLIDGIEISLYNENKEFIDKYITKKGIINITDLDIGKYYIKETKTKNNLILDDNYYEVELTKEEINKNIELINEYKSYDVTIKKLDKDTNIGINNTSFILYNDKDEKIDEYVTNEEGIIIVHNLKCGNYYLIESIANKDYKENKDKQFFSVVNDDTKVIIYNEKKEIIEVNNEEEKTLTELKEEIINVPITDKDENIFLSFVFPILSLLGLVYGKKYI